MLDFSVDREKCIQCGECVKDCIRKVLIMDEYPSVRPGADELCIDCQHCMAICKPGALNIFGHHSQESRMLDGNIPAPSQMEALIQGRRSIRRYKNEAVDPQLIQDILETTAYAPTAVNQRPVMLTVIDDKAAMDRLRKKTGERVSEIIQAGQLPKGLERIAGYFDGCQDGEDVIFRNAPHLLVASAPEDSLAPMADCHIAMSYFELLATTHGLGTVWDGIARAVITAIVPEIRQELGIPDNHLIACVMAFGKPAVKYHRTVQRDGSLIRKATPYC